MGGGGGGGGGEVGEGGCGEGGGGEGGEREDGEEVGVGAGVDAGVEPEAVVIEPAAAVAAPAALFGIRRWDRGGVRAAAESDAAEQKPREEEGGGAEGAACARRGESLAPGERGDEDAGDAKEEQAVVGVEVAAHTRLEVQAPHWEKEQSPYS